MPETLDFLTLAKGLGLITLVSGALTTLGFIFGWGLRFRLVGVTSFMGLLTAGVLALNLSLYQRVAVEGAERFTVVYDNGGAEVVIVLTPDTVHADSLEATLQQAANDLYSPGRLGRNGDAKLTVRARALLHQAGVTIPVYVGQVRRSLLSRDDQNLEIQIDQGAIAQVNQASENMK